MTLVHPYLKRPLRTEAQFKAEAQVKRVRRYLEASGWIWEDMANVWQNVIATASYPDGWGAKYLRRYLVREARRHLKAFPKAKADVIEGYMLGIAEDLYRQQEVEDEEERALEEDLRCHAMSLHQSL